MEKNIAVIWGDCSSPEIVKQTIRVLDKVAEKYGHTFHYTDAAMGGEAIDKYGDPLPQHELDKCLAYPLGNNRMWDTSGMGDVKFVDNTIKLKIKNLLNLKNRH